MYDVVHAHAFQSRVFDSSPDHAITLVEIERAIRRVIDFYSEAHDDEAGLLPSRRGRRRGYRWLGLSRSGRRLENSGSSASFRVNDSRVRASNLLQHGG